MISEPAEIYFCFPRLERTTVDKVQLVDAIMEWLRESGGIEYAGFLEDADLRESLLLRIGEGEISYHTVSDKQCRDSKKIINSAIRRCHERLPHPELPVFVLVFPWFPGKTDSKLFEGVMGMAPYVQTIHLYIQPAGFTMQSLEQAVVHEYSHLLFYYHNPQERYTLGETLVFEGIAEVFREEIVGGDPAPWSVALTQREAMKQFTPLKERLHEKDEVLQQEVLYGDGEYKRWTGYSIGYYIVKTFREEHGDMPWSAILQMSPDYIIEFFNDKGRTE